MTSEKLLQTMAVPSYPGVFVLGSFARYVTVYSQQVRALNLIDALCRRGMLSRHTRVAVIGGGVAGLTAAAGAAVLGAPVRLYERAAKPLRLQRNCGHRWLHPHLYDWPERESDSREAGLPLLTWEAGWAQDVAKRIEAQWDHIRQLEGVTLDPVFDVEDISLARSPVKDLTQVSWKQRGEAF